MIKIKSDKAKRVLAKEGDKEVIDFIILSAKYFGKIDLIEYEGKNEEKMRNILRRKQ